MPFDLHPACADVQILDAGEGLVKCVPPRDKVAIVGFGSNSRDLAPFDNPEFEYWGMNQGYLHMRRRADRWFEMHRPEHTADMRDPDYFEWLKACPVPVYMIDQRREVANSVRFPIEKILAEFKLDYFTSTIAYGIALALYEGFREIHLYGIDLVTDEEYFHQKACVEWWLGVAWGKGVNVYIPRESAIIKQSHRYGYEVAPSWGGISKEYLLKNIEQYDERVTKLKNEMHTVHGALQEARRTYVLVEAAMRGSTITTPYST